MSASRPSRVHLAPSSASVMPLPRQRPEQQERSMPYACVTPSSMNDAFKRVGGRQVPSRCGSTYSRAKSGSTAARKIRPRTRRERAKDCLAPNRQWRRSSWRLSTVHGRRLQSIALVCAINKLTRFGRRLCDDSQSKSDRRCNYVHCEHHNGACQNIRHQTAHHRSPISRFARPLYLWRV